MSVVRSETVPGGGALLGFPSLRSLASLSTQTVALTGARRTVWRGQPKARPQASRSPFSWAVFTEHLLCARGFRLARLIPTATL